MAGAMARLQELIRTMTILKVKVVLILIKKQCIRSVKRKGQIIIEILTDLYLAISCS